MSVLRIASITKLVVIGLLASCKDSSAPLQRTSEHEAIAYDLGPNASTCGDLVSLQKAEGTLDAPRPVSFQIAVCGHYQADEPSTEWKALGATWVSDKVQLVSAAKGGVDTAALASLLVAADGTLSARPATGESVTLGRAESSDEGAIVTLAAGVRMELVADGTAFDLKRVDAWRSAKEKTLRIYTP